MKKLTIPFLLGVLPFLLFGQRKITGIVIGEYNHPLYGININIKGTNIQTSTNNNGEFILNIKDNRTFVILFSSMTTVSAERAIPAGTEDFSMKVQLQDKTLGLPAIDIIGANPRSYRADIANSATRLDVPVMEVPASVGVVSKRLMDDQQVIGLNEALSNVSGISAKTDSYNAYGMYVARGFGLTASKNYFRNGVRFFKFSSSPVSNIERVEVLKGPASILYGSVEPGGIINFITKPTLPDARYSITARYGSYDFKQISADVSGPIDNNKKIRYRLNILKEKSNSFRDLVNKDVNHISPVIDLDLGPHTLLTIDADFFWNKQTVDPGTVAIGNGVAKNGRSTFLSEDWTYAKYRDINFGYKLNHEFSDNFKFRSHFRQYILNEDRLCFFMKKITKNNTYVDRKLRKWDADLRYTTFLNEIVAKIKTYGIGHNLLLGIEYGRYTNDRIYGSANYDSVSIFEPVYTDGPRASVDLKTAPNYYGVQNTYAIYLQDQISLTTKWKLLLGARADWIDFDKNYIAKKKKTKMNDFALSPRAGVLYMPSSNLSLYASYSQSFVPTAGQTKNGDDLKPITSNQFEIGAKTSFLNNRLLASVSLYDLRKKNMPAKDPTDPDFKVQIGEEHSKGIEFDLSGEITPSWNLTTSYAYTEAEISKSYKKGYPAGKMLSNVPKHNLSFWSSYHFNKGVLKGLSCGGGYSYTGERYGDVKNTFSMDSYSLFNAFTSYKTGPFKVALNVKNILDEEYFEAASGRKVVKIGTPRTFILSLSLSL